MQSPAAPASMKMNSLAYALRTCRCQCGRRCSSSGRLVSPLMPTLADADPAYTTVLWQAVNALAGVLMSHAAQSCCAGHTVLLVGGAVRDLLLGSPAKDYDLLTSAHLTEVRLLVSATESHLHGAAGMQLAKMSCCYCLAAAAAAQHGDRLFLMVIHCTQLLQKQCCIWLVFNSSVVCPAGEAADAQTTRLWPHSPHLSARRGWRANRD